MARSYGRIWTAIWNSDEWRSLTVDAQWVYEMLLTQSSVSPCGVLAATRGRWAKYAKGLTGKRIDAALTELVTAEMVIHDAETEEVFIRTFVRHDGAGANTLRMKAITDAASAVQSKTIIAALAIELDRAGIMHSLSIGVRGPIEGLSKGSRTSPVVVKEVGKEREPEPEPQPLTESRKGEPANLAAVAAPRPDLPLEEQLRQLGPRPTRHCDSEERCGVCGRRNRQIAEYDEAVAEISEKIRARAVLIQALCPLCDDNGMTETVPAVRCTHPETRTA